MAAEEKSIGDELFYPVRQANPVIGFAPEAESSEADCSNLAKQTDCLSQKLSSAVRLSSLSFTPHSLYDRPLYCIFINARKILGRAITLVRTCNHSGVPRQVFAIAATDDSRKVSALLESSIADNDRNKKMIVEEGGLVPSLKLLKEGASAEAQNAAAAALSNLEMPVTVEVLADSSMKVALANLVAKMNPRVQEFGRSTSTVLDDPTHKLPPDMAYSGFSRMSSRLKMALLSCCSRCITRTIEANFSETIEKAMPGVARIRVKGYNVVDGVLQPIAGYATAFCFSPGLIATNCHTVCSKDLSGNFKLYDVCVDAVNKITVPPTSVKVLAVNTGTDLAICQLLDDNNLPLIPLELGVGSRCRVGQQIFAIGHANTGSFGTQISRISHPSRPYNEVEISVPNSAKVPSDFCYIQTGLGTRFGMSGSPVMSTSGQVIGIHSSGTLSQPKVSHEIYTDYLLELIYWLLMNEKGSVFVHGDGVEGKSMG